MWLAPVFGAGLTGRVQGWIGDFFRTAWALPYWNARKTLFVLMRRRGQCPCHNPSDEGKTRAIGCEAVLGWRKPERFQRRVCPLLTKDAKAGWVCGVAPAQVRPFWGRAWAYAGVLAVLLWLVGSLTVWGAMRGVGYRVSVRQVVWPGAWGELRAVRAAYFVEDAQRRFAAGEATAAILSLTTAYALTPENYGTGLILAKFQAVGNPVAADRLFAELVRQYPAHRAETTQAWLRVLLANGRLSDVAELARAELKSGATQPVAWLHALIFAARLAQAPQWLELPESARAVSAEVRAVLEVERRVLAAPTPAAAVRRVRAEELPEKFPYARQQRAELMLAQGLPREALALLAASTQVLEGRVLVGLALAAEAEAGLVEARQRDARQLVDPARAPGAGELAVLALHLIEYPEPSLLKLLIGAWAAVPNWSESAARREATLTVLAAVAVGGSEAQLVEVRDQAIAAKIITHAEGRRVTRAFFPQPDRAQLHALMSTVPDLPLELSYALNRLAVKLAAGR